MNFNINEKEHLSQNIELDIDNVLSNINERNPVRLRDCTPKILVDYGVKNLPMYENPSHIRKNILTVKEAQKMGLSIMPNDNYHGLGKDLYMKVIDSLDKPRGIFKNKNEKDYLILTTLKNSERNNIIVPIEIETVTNIKIDINRIKSVYGRKNLNTYIKNNINQNIFSKIYEQKKERGTGTIPAASSFYDNNITNSNEIVNMPTEYSMQNNIDDTLNKVNSYNYYTNIIETVLNDNVGKISYKCVTCECIEYNKGEVSQSMYEYIFSLLKNY